MRQPPIRVDRPPTPTASIVTLWAPQVLRWCMRLAPAGVDPEDLAHDVLERLLEHGATLRDPQALPAWLYQTARRVVIDHGRLAWFRRWVPGLVPDRPDPRCGPGAEAERSEESALVLAILGALPLHHREVLVLVEMEERDGPEVAGLLGVPLGTVKSRLRRARAAFVKEAHRRGLTGVDGRADDPG